MLDKIINSKVLLTLKVGESGVLTCLICGLDKILKRINELYLCQVVLSLSIVKMDLLNLRV